MIRLQNKLLLLYIVLNISSCTTIKKPISENITFPHTFKWVAYDTNYRLIGFDHIANLTIYNNKINLKDEDVDLVINFDDIKEIKYEKPFFTDPNNYVIITYKGEKGEKIAYFTSYRYLGWVPGTYEIYEALIIAYSHGSKI